MGSSKRVKKRSKGVAAATPKEFREATKKVEGLTHLLEVYGKSKLYTRLRKDEKWDRLADHSKPEYFLLHAGSVNKMPVFYDGMLALRGLRSAAITCHFLQGKRKEVQGANEFCEKVKLLYAKADEVAREKDGK